jgi:hypothetical protein
VIFYTDCREMLEVEVVALRGVKIVGGIRVFLSFTKARTSKIFCQIIFIDPIDVLSHMIHGMSWERTFGGSAQFA